MVKVGDNGRFVIPAPLRRALDIEAGVELVVSLEDGALRVSTRRSAVERAQAAVRRHVGASESLVEELVKERRAEAKG